MRATHALGLLVAVTLAALALPTASAECTWNPDFTGPLEETGLVAFHDGPVCTVTPFPCPEDPRYSCRPW